MKTTVNTELILRLTLFWSVSEPMIGSNLSRTGGKQYLFVTSQTVKRDDFDYFFKVRLGSRVVEKHIVLPVVKFKYGHCPECDSRVYEVDTHHNESFCPRCGLVLEDSAPLVESEYDAPRVCYDNGYRGLKDEEKHVLRQGNRNNLFFTSKQAWSNYNDFKLIHAICCQARLNKDQKQLVYEIISSNGFKALHSRLSKELITLAVIRYVLKLYGVKPSYLRYRGLFSDLNGGDYRRVESNIRFTFV